MAALRLAMAPHAFGMAAMRLAMAPRVLDMAAMPLAMAPHARIATFLGMHASG